MSVGSVNGPSVPDGYSWLEVVPSAQEDEVMVGVDVVVLVVVVVVVVVLVVLVVLVGFASVVVVVGASDGVVAVVLAVPACVVVVATDEADFVVLVVVVEDVAAFALAAPFCIGVDPQLAASNAAIDTPTPTVIGLIKPKHYLHLSETLGASGESSALVKAGIEEFFLVATTVRRCAMVLYQ